MKTSADLIQQAYAQYAAKKAGTPWALTGGQTLIAELFAKPAGILPDSEPFGFVCEDAQTRTIRLIFRGTVSIDDWLTNAQISQIRHSYGSVHKGFDDLYCQMSRTARTAVGSAYLSGKKLIISGHSLGGALATLAARDFLTYPITLYTFASPRVGDMRFAATLNDQVFNAVRVVNTEDIVPTVPLSVGDDLLYCHFGKPICFTENTGTVDGNHSMILYQEKIQALPDN